MLLAICLAVGALAKACDASGTQTGKCTQCEMVGQTEVCTQCKANGNVPIDGACVPDSEAAANCKKAGGSELDGSTNVCGECSGKYFLYKGGCYTTTATPGKTMCKTAEGGKCTAAAAGYFIPPGATKADQSVVACSEGTEITANGKKYKGVTNCKVCTPPELNTENTAKPAVCTTCEDGYFGATCTACTDQNCATCDGGAGKCTKCKAAVDNKYLKKGDTVDANTCVSASACTTGVLYYTDDTDTTESGKTCKKCSEGVTNCAECTGPAQGKAKPACTKCTS